MNSARVMMAAVMVCAATVASARAQGPCNLVVTQAAQVLGAPAGKPERLSPAKTIEICKVPSADGSRGVSLTLETGQPAAQGVSMAKMIAKMSKDVGLFRDEAGLGVDAFSLREQDKVFFMFGAGSSTFNLHLTRDSGVTDADMERARQFAKQLLAAK